MDHGSGGEPLASESISNEVLLIGFVGAKAVIADHAVPDLIHQRFFPVAIPAPKSFLILEIHSDIEVAAAALGADQGVVHFIFGSQRNMGTGVMMDPSDRFSPARHAPTTP